MKSACPAVAERVSGFDAQRRFAAEALGTAFLVSAVVGSGIMAQRLAGGNGALALLCNTFPVGAILFVQITLFGPVSGAHLNPAVTLAMMLEGAIGGHEALFYVVVQIAGGLAGTCLAHLMFGEFALQISATARGGMDHYFSEFVATFGLVLTILACRRVNGSAIAACVSLYITGAYWFTASTSFANPAVTIARIFTASFSGIRATDAPGFIIAQFAGALVAFTLYRWLFDRTPDNDRCQPTSG